MRLLGFERLAEGGVKVKIHVSSPEDIWHLYHLLSVGDQLKTKTRRKVVRETSAGKSASDILTLVITIQVTEPAEYDPVGLVRVKGVNKTETQHIRMNQNHTHEVVYDPPQDVTLIKAQWDDLHEQHLQEACDEDARADTAAILMEPGLCHVCLVNASTCVAKAKIEVAVGKKRKGSTSREDSLARFFQQVLDAAVTHIRLDRVKLILIGSPGGHLREEFLTFVSAQAAKVDAPAAVRAFANAKSRMLLTQVSSGHKQAFNEALADKAVSEQMSQTKWAADAQQWDGFLRTMARTEDFGKCTYGAEPVFAAQAAQAVDTLFLCDETIRKAPTLHRKFFTGLSDDVRQSGGAVTMMAMQHAAGAQLQQMGGVAALLRLPMPQLEEMEVDPNFFNSPDVLAYTQAVRARRTESAGMGSPTTTSDRDSLASGRVPSFGPS